MSNTDTNTQGAPAASSASPPAVPAAAPDPIVPVAQRQISETQAIAVDSAGTKTVVNLPPKAPDVIKVSAVQATADAAAAEQKVKGLIATLMAEIEAVPGHLESDLTLAKQKIGAALTFVESHFTKAKATVATDAAAAKTAVDTAAATAKTGIGDVAAAAKAL